MAAAEPDVTEQEIPQQVGEPQQADEWVWLARIRRAQGRKGEVFADILTDFPEKFAERRRLWLLNTSGAGGVASKRVTAAPRAVELVGDWLHKGGIVLHFKGVDSITEAETLQGLVVAVPMAERAALGEDEFYTGDLIGCVLMDVAGAEPVRVGEIEAVDRTAGPVALLVVKGGSGEVLVPFARAFMRRIDLESKLVEMALPEGLAELNAAG